MALAIATNNAALNAAASASGVNRDMETSMARLSSGKRINSASDDAAGVAISSRLSAAIRGTDQAIRNSLDGQALIDTAEGAHREIENILQRMREVSVQAANDTNNSQDRDNLQAEMDAMIAEIDRIAGTTTWAGAKLMESGSGLTFSLQVGAATGEKNQIEVAIVSMASKTLGLVSGRGGQALTMSDVNVTSGKVASNDIQADYPQDLTVEIDGIIFTSSSSDGNSLGMMLKVLGEINASAEMQARGVSAVDNLGSGDPGADVSGLHANAMRLVFSTPPQPVNLKVVGDSSNNASFYARTAITTVDEAIKTVNTQRSELGAVSNRLTHTVNNLTNISSNLSAAKGGIEDADFALETTNLAKNQILQQASTAMLAQANASKQNVLSLLQG